MGPIAMDATVRKSLIVFLLLTFALSSIFYVWSFSGASLRHVAPPLMWMPGLAAIITQFFFYRTLAGPGWNLGPWRYLWLSILLPVVYSLVIYVPVWLTGLGRFNAGYVGHVLSFLPIMMFVSLLTALGEEIGWRGFL